MFIGYKSNYITLIKIPLKQCIETSILRRRLLRGSWSCHFNTARGNLHVAVEFINQVLNGKTRFLRLDLYILLKLLGCKFYFFYVLLVF